MILHQTMDEGFEEFIVNPQSSDPQTQPWRTWKRYPWIPRVVPIGPGSEWTAALAREFIFESDQAAKLEYLRAYLLEETALAEIPMRRLVPICIYSDEPLTREALAEFYTAFDLDLVVRFPALTGSSIQTLFGVTREPVTAAQAREQQNPTIVAAKIGFAGTIIGALIGAVVAIMGQQHKPEPPAPPTVIIYQIPVEQQRQVVPRLVLAQSADEGKQVFNELSGGKLLG